MSRGPDAGTMLIRAIEDDAVRAGCPVRTIASAATRWASATFAGARHEMTIEADATDALDRWLAALPEADLPMRGHLVADVAVSEVGRTDARATVTLEALTVED